MEIAMQSRIFDEKTIRAAVNKRKDLFERKPDGLFEGSSGARTSTAVCCGISSVTTFAKILTGYWAGYRLSSDQRAGLRAGTELVAHGEFSIVILGLGAAIETRLGSLSAAYVLIMAMAGPVLARITK